MNHPSFSTATENGLRRRPRLAEWALCAPFIMIVLAFSSCQSGLEPIDRRAQELVAEHTARINGNVDAVDLSPRDADALLKQPSMDRATVTERNPKTNNPGRDRFAFSAERGDRTLSQLLEMYTQIPENAVRYELQDVMALAVANSREYLTAKEELFLAALRLMNQRHLFGPRFFNDISADLDVLGEGGDQDIALRLANEFRVTQNLRTGGNVTARAVVNATEQLREVISDQTSQSASVILSADIPLLRGAGTVAEESLISAERDMVYATRTFERFRRQFLFDIATDYFDLVLAAGRVQNAMRVLESRTRLLDETEALAKAGRRALFDVNEARQRVLQSENSLASSRDSYVVSLERFRSRLGLPPDSPFLIKEQITFEIAVPELDMEESVRRGLMFRLDLQNTRDQVDDSRRAVRNARNELLPELNLNASVSAFTDDDLERAGLQFDFDETDFRAGVTYGLPLDRETERIGLRQSIISLERSQRRLLDSEDNVALAIRSAIRDIQLARFSLALQEESIRITEERIRGLELRRDQVSTRSFIDANDDLAAALEGRESALRDLRVAVLRFLLDTGQFRVSADGRIQLPPDLERIERESQPLKEQPEYEEESPAFDPEEGSISADTAMDEEIEPDA